MSFDDLYRSRLMTAAAAVARIPHGAKMVMGLAAAYPAALMNALAARARAGDFSGGSLYYMLSVGDAGKTVLAPELNRHIRPMSLFHGGIERGLDAARAANGGVPIDFIPSSFSQIPRLLTDHVGVDTLLTTVSPMDADGYFSLGTDTDYAHAVAHSGARLVLEVNPSMPYVHGDCKIHVSQVDALIENDQPILALPSAPPTDTDRAIGGIIAGMVSDGACLQMGIGALPDAVCAALGDHRHMGVHTELLSPGLMRLIESGAVDNSRKTLHPGLSIFSFALGDRPLYDSLHDNPAVAAYPVEYVNAPHIIARNDAMVSVNATLQVDLQGACNSEYMGGRQFSATGGQLDFVRGAYASKGGVSIIACHSTAAKGAVSRIVPWLDGPVTTPRTDTHYIVTEYGAAQMKGKSLPERARALIAIAHPDFREELEREARDRRIFD